MSDPDALAEDRDGLAELLIAKRIAGALGDRAQQAARAKSRAHRLSRQVTHLQNLQDRAEPLETR